MNAEGRIKKAKDAVERQSSALWKSVASVSGGGQRWIAQSRDIQPLTTLAFLLWAALSSLCICGAAPVYARRVPSVDRITICSYGICTAYSFVSICG